MGHARADVFRRHYMHQTVKVDTQSAYLGTTSRVDLIKNIGLMSTKRDPRAPVKVGPKDFNLQSHPEIATLTSEKERLAKSLQSACGTISTAKTLQPELYQKYISLRSKINARKRGLLRTELTESRKEWFEKVDHEEIKQQLAGGAPSVFVYTKPEFNCPLRSLIAEHYTTAAESTWANAVRALANLCRQKPPIHSKPSTGEVKCPFCLKDDHLRLSDRSHSFHNVGTLRKHISRKHAAQTTTQTSVTCPFAHCQTELDSGEHLKNHLSTSHDLNL